MKKDQAIDKKQKKIHGKIIWNVVSLYMLALKHIFHAVRMFF